MKLTSSFCLLTIAVIGFLVLPGLVQGAVLHVEADGTGEYPSIQAAMDAAVFGDTVLLAPGTYTDLVTRALEGALANSVAFLESGVTLESSQGAETTFIDGEFDHHCLVGQFLDPSTEVRGISLVNGYSSGQAGNDKWGGGVLVIDAGPLFEDNVFRDCYALGGGGFLSRRDFSGVGPTLRGNLFVDNQAGDLGGGLEISFVDSFVVEGNTFSRNHAFNQGGGGLLINGAEGVVDRNIFWANTGIGGGGGIGCIGGSVTTGSCNIFWENTGTGSPHVNNCGGIVIGSNNNQVADPIFCDRNLDDFSIRSNSPAAPSAGIGCGLVGAFPVGCGPVSVEATSWGQTKALYR